MEKAKTIFSVIFASLMLWIILIGAGFAYSLFTNPGHLPYQYTSAFLDAVYVETRHDDGTGTEVRFGVNPQNALLLLAIVAAVISLGIAAVKFLKKRKPAAGLDSAKEGYVLPEMKAENAAGFSAESSAESSDVLSSAAESDELSDFEREELIKQRLAKQNSSQNRVQNG